MKKVIILAMAFLISAPALLAQTKAGKADTVTHTTYYTCPKHKDVTMGVPGKCPQCGMDLSQSSKEQMKAKAAKNYSCPMHAAIVKHHPGKCPKCGEKLNLTPKEQMKAETTKLYICTMHPDVALDKEGNCPKCGMALIEKKKDN